MRFLADSNRRTRFCRPLTKPLIQGTIFFSFAVAKVVQILKLPTIHSNFSLYFFSLHRTLDVSFPSYPLNHSHLRNYHKDSHFRAYDEKKDKFHILHGQCRVQSVLRLPIPANYSYKQPSNLIN